MPTLPLPPDFDFVTLAFRLIRVLILLIVAWGVSFSLRRAVAGIRGYALKSFAHSAAGAAGGSSRLEAQKRADTLAIIGSRSVSIGIWMLAGFMALRELGFDIAPLLAGAGVAGLAIGFGAQNLVKDVLTGLFMLLDNQIRVNDVAIINGTGGLVERINLRTTELRSMDGTVHIFRNGSIETLANMTREFSFYVFNLRISWQEDPERVMDIVREVGEDLRKDIDFSPKILEPVEILGVDQLGESAVVLQARIKTLPIQQWNVGREMNRRLKKRFDEEGVKVGYPAMALEMRRAEPIRAPRPA